MLAQRPVEADGYLRLPNDEPSGQLRHYQPIPVKVAMPKDVHDTLTSEELMTLIFETGFFWDTLYTIPRLVGVVFSCLEGAFTVGPMFEYLAAHPEYSIPYLAGTILLCVFGFTKEYDKQLAAHKNRFATFVSMFRNLTQEVFAVPGFERMSAEEKAETYNTIMRARIDFFNQELKAVIDEGYKNKYKQFKLIRPLPKITNVPKSNMPEDAGISRERIEEKIDVSSAHFLVLARSDEEIAEIEKKEKEAARIEKEKRYQNHGLPDELIDAKVTQRERELDQVIEQYNLTFAQINGFDTKSFQEEKERATILELIKSQHPEWAPDYFNQQMAEASWQLSITKRLEELKRIRAITEITSLDDKKARALLMRLREKQAESIDELKELNEDEEVIPEDENSFKFKAKKKLKSLWSNYIVPAWEKTMAVRMTVFIAAFIYWLEWAAAASFTGEMGVGVVGMHPILAFGIPIFVAGCYAVNRIYHYIKNDEWHKSKEESEKTKQAELESEEIIAKVNRRMELRFAENESNRLVQELQLQGVSQEEIQTYLPAPSPTNKFFGALEGGAWAKTKALSTFVTTFMGEHNADQYNYWVVSDLIQLALGIMMTVPFVNLAVGIVVIGFSALMAGIAMYKRYNDVSSVRTPEFEEGSFPRTAKITYEELKETHSKQKDEIIRLSHENEALRKEINALIKADNGSDRFLDQKEPLAYRSSSAIRASLVEPDSKGYYDTFKDTANNIMSGAFFGRILVAGAAIFIACTIPVGGIPAIVVISVLAVAFLYLKGKESKQKSELAKSKELLGSSIPKAEQELDILRKENANLKMRKALITAKLAKAAKAEKVSLDPDHAQARRMSPSLSSISSPKSPSGGSPRSMFSSATTSPDEPSLERRVSPSSSSSSQRITGRDEGNPLVIPSVRASPAVVAVS